MSGIAAVARFDGERVDRSDLERMAAPVPHRTAGAVDIWTSARAGAAHLSAHPTGPGRSQPLVVDGVVVVAHARIDNVSELAGRLTSVLPEEPSPAEVVLAAYRTWGTEAAGYLIGDFAFVVWDERRGRMYAARDPMAMRPLYYRVEPGRRAFFASEAKQILAMPGVPRRPNEAWLAAYMAGIFPPLWATPYEGLKMVPPGCSVVVDGSGEEKRRHWSPDESKGIRYRKESDYAEHLRSLFIDSVRARVSGNQPVGVLLSGGLDSGAAAGTAGWLKARSADIAELRSYSWAFSELVECDERDVSSILNRSFDITPTDVPADDAGPLAGYPEHGPDEDSPFIGAFQPLMDRAMGLAAADGCGAMLLGVRGDLIAGGWVLSYPHLLVRREFGQLVRELRDHRLATDESRLTIAWRYLAAPILQRLGQRPLPQPWNKHAAQSDHPPWLPPSTVDPFSSRDADPFDPPPPDGASLSRTWRHSLIFSREHMHGAVWLERSCAKAGLDYVDPWSSRAIVEFALAIPQQLLSLPGSADKRLVRTAMEGIVPDRFLEVAGKTLPSPLYRAWLYDRAAPVVRKLLTDSKLDALGLIDADVALEAYETAVAGGAEPVALWDTLSTEMWLRAYWQ